MRKVKHHEIHNYLDVHADDFKAEMALGLDNILMSAHSLGSTVDWSTLRIETPETVYAVDMAGNRTAYQNGVMLLVDSVIIEEEDE